MIEIDDYNESKNEARSKIMKKMTKDVKETLDKILSPKSINTNIFFTSFKHPNKTFVTYNTIDTVKQLETTILLGKKKSNYRNIVSLVSTMKKVLIVIVNKVIQRETFRIDNKIKDLEYERRAIYKKKNDTKKQCEETSQIIKKSIDQIENIKKEKDLNTHERYNNYLKQYKGIINGSEREIYNSVIRMELNGYDLQKLNKKLNEIKQIKNLDLEENESIWKKYFQDDELNEKKHNLENDKYDKKILFKFIESILSKIEEECCKNELNNVNKEKLKLIRKKENIVNNSEIIKSIKNKVDNIDNFLLEDIEKRVAKWEPRKNNKNDNFFSFLELYSLLDEHNLVKNKTI